MDSFGIAIFCDDIREEVGGKISLIGCYGNDIEFTGANYPITVPKLGIFATARLPPELPAPDLHLIVHFPGDDKDSPSMRFEVPRQDPLNVPHPYAPQDLEEYEKQDLELSHSVRFPVILSPVLFKQDGFVRVRLLSGTKRLRLGALKVHLKP